MAIICHRVDGEKPYHRIVTGWVDGREDGALRFTARLTDDRVDLDVTLVARPSPDFEILSAQGGVHSVSTRARCSHLLEQLPNLAGARIASGFRRQVAAMLGPDPWAIHVIEAAVEAARLSRQVTRVGPLVPANLSPRDFHRLDLVAWPEFADMCFTYRAESTALFDERSVSTPAVVDMYAPNPGKKMVFHRYKRTEVTPAGQRLRLYQSMFDQVHGFELWYDLDASTHEILSTKLLTPRLPYMGICEQPQDRVRSLVGIRLDDEWARVVREKVGGRQGCFQLTELTGDLFRLLTFE